MYDGPFVAVIVVRLDMNFDIVAWLLMREMQAMRVDVCRGRPAVAVLHVGLRGPADQPIHQIHSVAGVAAGFVAALEYEHRPGDGAAVAARAERGLRPVVFRLLFSISCQ